MFGGEIAVNLVKRGRQKPIERRLLFLRSGPPCAA
jgi:hypothetical protein